ncbi:VTT domain-containing protein [Candidatus Parcubacteria bacterium]|nr:VTT domain-containing protein [Candidatus Parcubacteria bacterium]
MFAFVQNWILQAGAWSTLGFFVGAFLEEVAFPLPSPLLLVGVAFFFGKPITIAAIGKMLGTVILPITFGATLGSLVVFGIAYSGGRVAITKFSKYLGFSWDEVEKVRVKLASKHSDEWTVFVSRCIPYTPTTIVTVLAGIVRMNVWKFILLTFGGIFVRVAGLFVGAFIFGQSIFK